ncbi:diguanylate cyclase [Chelatococcus daeguensis]|uniref:diguanylate cyclase n=1 Tax=Chelatococcus daeguensis TaxID=444444 RepID=A0AAC9JU12_9HYPH|nr:GGDEF domain-containing protein [Chelatococcus daeguensis]APF39226.1 diguanylate cyclase [Chelatococcus daeguensis]KZE28986.1 diguanylate cyclase [Chelatococcus daeguensis]MBM3083679.1 diguanylate cyclase [Chelatococcus daeguensis]
MEEVVQELSGLFEETPVLIAVYDGFDRLRYANKAFRAAYFIEPGEMPLWADLMRRNHQASRGTVIHAADFEEWLRSTQSRRGKMGFRAFETDLLDGRWLWMTETMQADGWMLCIASDITGLRARSRAVRQDRDLAIKASYTDELTGVANRRFVMGRIEDMLQRGAAVRGCLAVLDIDGFKAINDRFGHQTGDQILRDFTIKVHGLVQRTHCFGRVGGEEFVLVMPGTSLEEAALIVEKMLVIVRKSRPLTERPDFGYTFSAGIAACREGDIALSLYSRADKALYCAKMAGRNRIQLDGSDSDQSAASG